MTGLDHESRPIGDAAAWLAANGPGQLAVSEARIRFGLNPSELGEVCARAGEIRRDKREVSQ